MSNVQPLTQGESLAVGDQSDHVQELQQMLRHLGYYQGEVDAYYGEVLEQAVKAFQSAVGQVDDGRTGPEIWHEVAHAAASSGYGQALAEAEQVAEQAAIQIGQLSEDGAWQWNGTDWVAAGTADLAGHAAEAAADAVAIQVGQLSEDGHWQWNGSEWKAAGGDAQAPEVGHAAAAGEGAGHPAEGAGQGANHPALDADPNADIPKLTQDDFHMAIADTMTVHAGEEA